MENYIIDTDYNLSKWAKGISYEIAFWNNVYRWKWTYDGMMNWSHYGKEICLEGFDANSFLAKTARPIVLDVGCGMSYATGNYIKKSNEIIPLDIHYIDPLADYFNTILKRHHRLMPTIEFGMIEYLSSFYLEKNIDMIIIQNALDHSYNPCKGILEALDCLKSGGILYLNHHANEAETEHYKGFHQFNINNESGELIIWNKNKKYDIGKILADFTQISVNTYSNGHIIAVIKKTGEVPQRLLSAKQDRLLLSKTLIRFYKNQNNVWRAVSNKTEYWFFNIIQFFIQALPWGMKMRIKKAIKQA